VARRRARGGRSARAPACCRPASGARGPGCAAARAGCARARPARRPPRGPGRRPRGPSRPAGPRWCAAPCSAAASAAWGTWRGAAASTYKCTWRRARRLLGGYAKPRHWTPRSSSSQQALQRPAAGLRRTARPQALQRPCSSSVPAARAERRLSNASAGTAMRAGAPRARARGAARSAAGRARLAQVRTLAFSRPSAVSSGGLRYRVRVG